MGGINGIILEVLRLARLKVVGCEPCTAGNTSRTCEVLFGFRLFVYARPSGSVPPNRPASPETALRFEQLKDNRTRIFDLFHECTPCFADGSG
eukprot:2153384-Prymnesium_polylepis.1